MSERVRLTTAWLLAALVVMPLLVLAIWAFADAWRAPALLPQQLGLRGFRYVSSPGARAGQAVWNSLVVGVASTTLALLVGWPAARVLAESRLTRGVTVFLVLALPLLVPGYATGIGLTEWFLRLGLTDSWAGLVLAHLIYVQPYVVLILTPAFGREVENLEEAARSLGAGALRRLALVTVPAVAPTLGAAALVGFLVSLSQYGTSLAVGGGIPMLPLVLLPFVPTDPQIASALAILFLAPALAALALAVQALRRSAESA